MVCSCISTVHVGLLGPPPGLRIDNLNSTTLFVSWSPPSTLRGIPISHYSVDVNNFITTSTVNVTAADHPSLDPNMTSLDLSRVGSVGYLCNPSCESLQFRVRAWNSVGGGASSSVLYSQGSIQHKEIYILPCYSGMLSLHIQNHLRTPRSILRYIVRTLYVFCVSLRQLLKL